MYHSTVIQKCIILFVTLNFNRNQVLHSVGGIFKNNWHQQKVNEINSVSSVL